MFPQSQRPCVESHINPFPHWFLKQGIIREYIFGNCNNACPLFSHSFCLRGPTSYLHHFSYAAPICILLEALIFYIKAWICRKIEHGRTWQLSSMRRLLFEAHDLPSMFSKRVCYDFFNRCHKWCKIEWFESSGWQIGCFFYTNIVFYVIWLMFFIYSMFYVFSVFSMFSQLTPCSPIQDGRMEQLVKEALVRADQSFCFYVPYWTTMDTSDEDRAVLWISKHPFSLVIKDIQDVVIITKGWYN